MGNRGRARRVGFAASAALALFAIAPAAHAVDIPVTTTADVSADDGACSLREAVTAAMTNAAVGPMTGDDCPAGVSGGDDYVQLDDLPYSIAGAANEDLNVTGDIDVSWAVGTPGFLVIDGVSGANGVPLSIVDGNDLDRIFDVQSGGTPAMRIQDVVLTDGRPSEANSDGGAVLVRDDDAQFSIEDSRVTSSHANRWGGGLANLNGGDGIDIDVRRTEFSGNDADDEGGGIWVDVPQDYGTGITRSSFVGNHTDTMGGAIYIKSDGDTFVEPVVDLRNSTLSGNTATLGGGGIGFAFGAAGTVFVRFSTLAGNSTATAGAGGGIHTDNDDNFILATGSIISANTAAGSPLNCAGPGDFSAASSGNVESGTGCFPGVDNVTNANPLLSPLAIQAGGAQNTRSYALNAGSPALDILPASSCNTPGSFPAGVDQRGVARPVGAGCDAGSYEGSLPGPAAQPPAAQTPPATTTPAATACTKKKKKKKGKAKAAAKCKKKKKKKKKK